MTNNSSTSNPTLDLKSILNPTSAEEKNSDLQAALWNDLEARLKPNINGDGSKVCSSTPASLRISHDRVHEAILIEGRRGEGKTTVLLQLLHKIETGKLGYENYLSLGLLDPTLLETKQNLILSIVQRIREHFRQVENKCGCMDDERGKCIEEARNALRELAKGVTTLDGVGKAVHDEDWASAEFIMDDGLDRARAAYNFEQSFRQFVKCAAKAVGCDAFVLGIDDADTKFEMGAPVLEALRKYLTTPYLRVVVSGDPELLQSLARKIQLKGIGRGFLDFEQSIQNEHSNNSRIVSLLDQLSGLEDQFLTKILPPQRRFRLKTLNEIQQESQGKVQLIWQHRKEGEVSLQDELDELISPLWGARDSVSRRRFRQAILSMPVRSIVEFLEVWDREEGDRKENETSIAAERLAEIARSYLSDFGLRIDELHRFSDGSLRLRRIVSWLSERKERWGVFANLQPDGAAETNDRAIMAISAIITSDLLSSPQGVLQYWLIFNVIKESVAQNYFASQDDLSKFMAHLQLTRVEPLSDMVARLAAWRRTSFGSKSRYVRNSPAIEGIPVATDRVRNPFKAIKFFYGLNYNEGKWNSFVNSGDNDPDARESFVETLAPPIKGFHEKILAKHSDIYGKPTAKQQGRLSGALYNSIEELSRRVDSMSATLLMLPYSKISSGQKYEFGNYSFLKLLSGIETLLGAGKDDNEKIENAEVGEILGSWLNVRSFPIAHSSDDEVDYNDEDIIEDDSTTDDLDIKDLNPDLLTRFSKWINNRPKHDPIAASALSNSWSKLTDGATKVFQNAGGVGAKLGKRRRFVGHLMHRNIVVFLHALGVEMYLREGGELGIRVRNSPTNADDNFLDLLQQIKKDVSVKGKNTSFENTAGGALFYHLLKCPLWAYYLEPTTVEKINGYLEKTDSLSAETQYLPPAIKKGSSVEFDGLYYLLNTVAIPEEGNR